MAFEFVLTTEEIRQKMFDFLRNLRRGKDFDDGIEWGTGIFDKENNVFMTLIYFTSGLGHCDDTLKCIVIANNSDIFIAHLYGRTEKDQFTIPEEYENLRYIVKEGLIYYDDWCYLDDYDNINKKKQQKLDEINEMMNDRFHESFTVNCEDDARKLFELCGFYYATVIRKYNKRTVKAFDRYATEEKMLAWRSAEYKKLLEEGIVQKENFKKWMFSHLLWLGVDDTCDELYYQLIEKAVEQPNFNYNNDITLYIEWYMEKYPDKVNSLIPLLDMLDAHINGIPDIHYKHNILSLKEKIEKARKLINKE